MLKQLLGSPGWPVFQWSKLKYRQPNKNDFASQLLLALGLWKLTTTYDKLWAVNVGVRFAYFNCKHA